MGLLARQTTGLTVLLGAVLALFLIAVVQPGPTSPGRGPSTITLVPAGAETSEIPVRLGPATVIHEDGRIETLSPGD